MPVGFVMSVTPQINANGNVSLNVRPTLTRILGFVVDPAPAWLTRLGLRQPGARDPRQRDRVAAGGGRRPDRRHRRPHDRTETTKNRRRVPYSSRLPAVGNLFNYRDETVKKSELVLFLRPTVIRGAGVGRSAVARADLPLPLSRMRRSGRRRQP